MSLSSVEIFQPFCRRVGEPLLCHAIEFSKCFLHFGLDLRRARVAEIAHIGGKVRRTDEDTIDAIDRGNLVRRGKPCRAFDLQEQADPVICCLQIVRNTIETGARASAAPTPRTPCGG